MITEFKKGSVKMFWIGSEKMEIFKMWLRMKYDFFVKGQQYNEKFFLAANDIKNALNSINTDSFLTPDQETYYSIFVGELLMNI